MAFCQENVCEHWALEGPNFIHSPDIEGSSKSYDLREPARSFIAFVYRICIVASRSSWT